MYRKLLKHIIIISYTATIIIILLYNMSTNTKKLPEISTLNTRTARRNRIIPIKSESDSDSDTSYQCSSSSEQWTPSSRDGRRSRSPSPPSVGFECAVCSETFESKAAIKKHTKNSTKCRAERVNSAFQHECEGCGKMFRIKCQLDRHRCANRVLNTKYKCKLCEKQYSRADRLNKHVRDKHAKEKANKTVAAECKTCGMQFGRNFDLIRHMRAVHMSEKPHQCDDCGRKFAFKSNMHEHRKRAHDHDAAKASSMFPCPNCDKQFTRRYNLNVHVSTVHENKKSYVCPLCKQSLGSNRALKNHHEAKHGPANNERSQFKCSVCDKRFTQKSNLSSHEKRLHNSA